MKHRIRLNATDYKKILEYYKLKIPTRSTLSNLKKRAEKALVEKICNCTKKLKSQMSETKAIGVCANSVLKKKKLIYHRFTCKKSSHFIPVSARYNSLHKSA
jgi:peptide deformylase